MLGDDDEGHARMLQAAKFGALAAVFARLRRLDPQDVVLAGNEVYLAREVRHPQGMDHVGRA